MDILLVGGKFNDNNEGVRRSEYIQKIYEFLDKHKDLFKTKKLGYINGGNLNGLQFYFNNINLFDCVLWFPEVSDKVNKQYREIKKTYPKIMLVTTKQNYDFQLLSNLIVEFDTKNGSIKSRVIDPLGDMCCDFDTDIAVSMTNLLSRLSVIMNIEIQGANK